MKMLKFLLVGIVVTFVLINQTAQANDNLWSSNGPYGASVLTIAIHPFNNQIIYIGTVENGIYKSTEGGANWFHLDNDTLTDAMRVIKIHPFGPDTVYATTANSVFKSTDDGTTWSHFGPSMAGEFRALAIHPKNPAIMMLGTWRLIYKTTDGGINWTSTEFYDMIQDIEFDPIDSNRIYLANQGALGGRSVYRSDDLGDTWQCIHNDLDSLGIAEDLAVDPVNPQIIYLAEHSYMDSIPRCVSKTTDGGQHWIDISPPNLDRPFIFGVTVSPLDHNTIFACTAADGVFKSIDGGNNWQKINSGIKINEVALIVVDSTTGVIYLGTFLDGVYRSTDGGETWEKISYHIFQGACIDIAQNIRSPDSLYTATSAGIYGSFDGSQTWAYIDLGLPFLNTRTSCVSIDRDPLYIYVGLYPQYYSSAYGGLARSTNGGVNWDIINNNPIERRGAIDLVVSYAADSTRRLFFASDSGLYYSDNIGSTWQLCQGDLPVFHCSALEVSPGDNNMIFVSSFLPSLFYQSTDRGNTWSQIENITSSYWTNFIRCDPVNSNIVYADAGVDLGIYKSTDFGESWFELNNNLPRDASFFDVSGFCINPLNSQEMYINSYNKGVFVSYDGGSNWIPFSDGLQFLGYGSADIKINPVDTTKIVMSTFGGSVWSIHRTAEGVSDESPKIPNQITLFPNYPNPFNAQTTIKYTLSASSNVSLEIFDIAGRKVETLLSAYQQAGEHAITWNAENRPSGIYFYRLKAGETTKTAKCILLK